MPIVKATGIIVVLAALHFLLCCLALWIAWNGAWTPVFQGDSNPNSPLATISWHVFHVFSFPLGGPLNSLLWAMVIYIVGRVGVTLSRKPDYPADETGADKDLKLPANQA